MEHRMLLNAELFLKENCLMKVVQVLSIFAF